MSDVKQFEILGEVIKCKDEFARNEIAKLKIKNKNIIMIGDSYGEGYTPEGVVKSWIAYVQEYLPANYITSAIGGSGFVNGTTFLNQLVTITNKLSQTEKDSIDDIIVAGGYNDKGYSQDIITSAMSVFANYARTNYKNAKLHVIELGWGKDLHSRTDIFNNVFPAYAQSAKYGMIYFQNCCYALHDYRLFSSDGFHPNANGQVELANAITSYILSGSYTYNSPWHTLPISPRTEFGTPETNYVGCSITNDIVNLNIIPCQFETPDITLTGGEYIKIGTIQTDVISGYNKETPFCEIDVPAWAYDGIKYYSFNARLTFDSTDNSLYIMITNTQPDGTGYFILNNTKQFRLMGAQSCLPSYLC